MLLFFALGTLVCGVFFPRWLRVPDHRLNLGAALAAALAGGALVSWSWARAPQVFPLASVGLPGQAYMPLVLGGGLVLFFWIRCWTWTEPVGLLRRLAVLGHVTLAAGVICAPGMALLPEGYRVQWLLSVLLVVAVTLPVSMKACVRVERSLQKRSRGRELRRAVRQALRGKGLHGPLLVRFKELDGDSAVLTCLDSDGEQELAAEEQVLATAGGPADPGQWLLVQGPRVVQVASGDEVSYREVATRPCLAGADRIRSLGPDYRRVLAGDAGLWQAAAGGLAWTVLLVVVARVLAGYLPVPSPTPQRRLGSPARIRHHTLSCRLGSKLGCHGLLKIGIMYHRGWLVAKDHKLAAELYRDACKGGSGPACNNLGVMYEGGHGVAPSQERAFRAFKQSCQRGIGLGCANLGRRYQYGRGVDRDLEEAVRVYRKACTRGSGLGCTHLGSMYFDGRGVPKNKKQAFQSFHRACQAKHPLGCDNLGIMYQYGHGVAKSREGAVKAYKKACERGRKSGCRHLDKLSKP